MIKANYIDFAYQFWNLTREAICEMEKLGNKSMIISDRNRNETEEESELAFQEKIKWNDLKVGVPILYNFYHGLELFMKGLLQEVGKLPTEKNHRLSKYYDLIDENRVLFTSELIDLLKRFIEENNPFQSFFDDNDGRVDDFYLFLRYPESRSSTQSYKFKEIRGNEKPGLERFLEIRQGCIDLRNSFIKWKINVA